VYVLGLTLSNTVHKIIFSRTKICKCQISYDIPIPHSVQSCNLKRCLLKLQNITST